MLAPPTNAHAKERTPGLTLQTWDMEETAPASVADAVRAAHEWFEHNSGWAPPDPDTLAEWIADGVCRCPDACLVAPEGICEHGLASWLLILRALEDSKADF